MIKKTFILGLTLVAAASQAYVVVDKTADLGDFWNNIGPSNTPIYTNSFVFNGATGDAATVAGTYLRVNGTSGVSSTFQFQLLADSGNAPSATVLASSAFTSTTSSTLTLLTANLSANSLVNGTRYWLALNSVGGSGGDGYQVGGHTQNSIYNDNGTFWYSNAGSLSNWDGQNRVPEMAIYVEAAPVPEPASMAALGLGALALIRRKRKAAKA